jgi:hypothetical protein
MPTIETAAIPPPPGSTWYAGRTRLQAALILSLVALGLVWLLQGAVAPPRPASRPAPNGHDLRVYRTIVNRVHVGESYYVAAGDTLRAEGYATASPFNWRLPVYAWLIGALPDPEWARWLLIALELLALFLAFAVLRGRNSPWTVVVALILLIGAFQWALDGEAFLAQELWAGVLIALSILIYARGRWLAGALTGLAGLFVRELVMPYCLIALVLAWRQRRRREVVLWLTGLACYAAFLAWHRAQVLQHVTAADRAPQSWIQFGGADFLLATSRMNEWLFKLPAWVRALYLVVALVGLAGWRGDTGLRCWWTTAAYLAAFAVVGQPFNEYWGLLYAALLPLGIAQTPAAWRDLRQALRRSKIPHGLEPQGSVPFRADRALLAEPAQSTLPAVQ